MSGATLSHSEATPIVREAWYKIHGREPTTLETLYTQAIASLETGYGRAGQFAAMAANGQYNWGAEQRRRGADGECPPGFASGIDQGQVCFYVFPSDVDAAAAFIRTLTKTKWDIIPAMTGSPEDVATAMRRAPAYYGGPPGTEEQKIAAYANAIRQNAKNIGATLEQAGETVKTKVKSNAGVIIAGLALLGIAGGGTYYAKREKLI